MKKLLIVSYIDLAEFDLKLIDAPEGTTVMHCSQLPKGEKLSYAIVNDIDKMASLRAEFQALNLDVKFIYVGRNNKIQDFFDLSGGVLLDPVLLKDSLASSLVKRSLSTNPAIHLQEIFGNAFEQYYTYKISNIYRLGYFADLVCKDAIQQKLNFVSIRTFFDHAMLFNSYLVDLGLASFPCEMEFAFKEGQLVLMLHIAASGVKQNHLIESLGEDTNKNPLASLLKTCFKQADYLDVVNFPKAKRLSIIGLWLNDEIRSQLITPSIAITTIDDSHNALIGKASENYKYNFDHQSDPKELEALDKLQLPQLPGAHKKMLESTEDSVFKNEEGLLQEITSFVQQRLDVKNLGLDDPSRAINVNDLSVEEVKKILADHPDQKLVQQFKKVDEQLLTSVVTSGKAAEELIQVVSGKVAKDNEKYKVKLNSAAKEISHQISVRGSFFKESSGNEVQFISSSQAREKTIDELIHDPFLLLDNAKFEVAGEQINLEPAEVQVVSASIKDMLSVISKDPVFLSMNVDDQQSAINEQVQKVITSTVPQKIISKAKPVISDEIKISMGSIEQELVTKFSAKDGPIHPEEQAEIIANTVLKNVMNTQTVIRGDKTVENAVYDIIQQMNIPEEQKQIFIKTIKIKIKDIQAPLVEQITQSEEITEEIVYQDEITEVEEIIPGQVEKKKVTKIVKVPKTVVKQVYAKPTVEIEEEIVYQDEITEIEEIIPGQVEKKIVTKIIKVPKTVVKQVFAKAKEEIEEKVVYQDEISEVNEIKPELNDKRFITNIVKVPKTVVGKTVSKNQVEVKRDTAYEDELTTIVSGAAKENLPEKKTLIKHNNKLENKSLNDLKVVSGEEEQDQVEVQVIGGKNTFKHDAGYKFSKPKKRSMDNIANDEADEAVSGEKNFESDKGYKVKVSGTGATQQDDGYQVKVSGAKNAEKVTDFKVADNSHLVSKIEELEEKLKIERQYIRDLEKPKIVVKEKVKAINDSVKAMTKDIQEPDLNIQPTPSAKIEAVVKEISESSGLSNMQKEKMLEVLKNEKKINEKYSEIQEAYRKTKMALDTQENRYSSEIEELERSNRHKELLVEQMKTKVSNIEKDKEIEIKRISSDIKKQQQRSGLADTDKFKQKITSLEREKNAMKRMMDDLKDNVSKERTKSIDEVAKSSPKVLEFEAQKMRAEVKLSSTQEELADLKKTMSAKDSAAKQVAEQRYKLQAEASKWKKDALTKKSEVEKAVNEKKRAEEELASVKRRYEELNKEFRENTKVNTDLEQAVVDNKATAIASKLAEDKMLKLKEELTQEKMQISKELSKEKEHVEEMKKSYLIEANKVKGLEAKAKEMADTIAEQAAALKSQESAVAEATAKITTAGGATANITAKDLSALATKNRLLEESSKKIIRDYSDAKAKLDDAKKEIINLTKKTNENQFKLQEKEKLAERLQNELKAIKDKEAELKKKEAEAKKAA